MDSKPFYTYNTLYQSQGMSYGIICKSQVCPMMQYPIYCRSLFSLWLRMSTPKLWCLCKQAISSCIDNSHFTQSPKCLASTCDHGSPSFVDNKKTMGEEYVVFSLQALVDFLSSKEGYKIHIFPNIFADPQLRSQLTLQLLVRILQSLLTFSFALLMSS